MFKKLLSVLSLSAFLSTLSFATDLLAFYSNGKLTENSPGVKVLSLEEKKNVRGGYGLYQAPSGDAVFIFQNSNLGSVKLTQIGFLIEFSDFEIKHGVSCGFARYECQHFVGTYRAKSDFNDVASVANPKRKEFLALTATKTTTIGLFGLPQYKFSNGFSVVGVYSGGLMYKIRNTNARGIVANDMKSRFQKQLNNILATQF